MRSLIPLLIAFALPLAGTADARMYQWAHPATGVTQLSGEPPPWYRSGRGGPRVVVFERGRLVDDTAIALTPEQDAALRAEAFENAAAAEQAAAVRALERAGEARERAAARARADAARAAALTTPSPQPALSPPPAADSSSAVADDPASEPAPPEAFDSDLVQALKAIVEAYDRQVAPPAN